MTEARKRTRRGRSEGALYRRGDGVWVASASLGIDANGKRVRRTMYGATKGEAQEKLKALHLTAGSGKQLESDKLSLSDFLTKWLAIQINQVAPSTYARYETHCRLHINEHLGGVRLAKLNPAHVDSLYSDMKASGDSTPSQHKTGKTLRQALKYAVDKGLIPSNPATAVKLPRLIKQEMRVWNSEQVSQFLRVAESDRLYALYVFALDFRHAAR